MRNDGKLMATQKAPVALTGGAGFEFEARIAARLMVDMLRGRCALGSDLGAVQLLSWQARESGWLLLRRTPDAVIERVVAQAV